MDVAPEDLVEMLELLRVRGNVEGQHDRLPRVNAHARGLRCLHQRAGAVELERHIVEHGGDELMGHAVLVMEADVGARAGDEQDPFPTLALCDVDGLIFHHHFRIDFFLRCSFRKHLRTHASRESKDRNRYRATNNVPHGSFLLVRVGIRFLSLLDHMKDLARSAIYSNMGTIFHHPMWSGGSGRSDRHPTHCTASVRPARSPLDPSPTDPTTTLPVKKSGNEGHPR